MVSGYNLYCPVSTELGINQTRSFSQCSVQRFLSPIDTSDFYSVDRNSNEHEPSLSIKRIETNVCVLEMTLLKFFSSPLARTRTVSAQTNDQFAIDRQILPCLNQSHPASRPDPKYSEDHLLRESTKRKVPRKFSGACLILLKKGN